MSVQLNDQNIFERKKESLTDLLLTFFIFHFQVTHNDRMKLPLTRRLEMRKAVDLVSKVEETKRYVCQAFHVCPEIQKVAVLIGATIVSPKEVFVIHLPPLNPDADNLSGKDCVKTLFRQLIMQDPLGNVKQISPTNIFLLLYAPRKSELSWFLPKLTYKLPARGMHFEFHLQSKCGQGTHDLSTNCSLVELSGFEPFDSFLDECEEVSCNSNKDTISHSSEGSLTADYICIDSDHDLEILNTNDLKDLPLNQTIGASNCDSVTKRTEEVKSNVSSDHCETATEENKRIKKSESASSILSETRVMSKNSKSSVSSINSYEEENTSTSSLSDSECIWFQSPLLIKGYSCK